MATNQAAWLDGQGKQLRVATIEVPTPGPDEIVVHNHAVAVNPVDWKVQDYGIIMTTWPNVIGEDLAGEVYDVGANVTRFKKGDRVLGHPLSLLSQRPSDGAFQHYTVISAVKAAHIPQNLSYTQAAVIPLGLDTAIVGLLTGLDLPAPSLSGPIASQTDKTIVVYGASSAVGANAVQLAAQIGVKVVAVASEHNFEFVKALGASQIVDYRSGDVVANVGKAVERAGGKFVGAYDVIGSEESYRLTVPIVEKLGGGILTSVAPTPDDIPKNVTGRSIWGVGDVTNPIWESYLTPALERGLVKAVPEPLVIGKGLEQIQAGLDLNKKGVSAKKVVVEL